MMEKSRNWLEVMSHLHPKYGGLSAAVPAMCTQISRGNGWNVSLAAFCTETELYQPSGLEPEELTYWPVTRMEWIKDYVSGGRLHLRFERMLRGCDGLHIHGLWEPSTLVAARSATALDVPYIISAHGMLEPWALATKGWKKQMYAAVFERNNLNGATCLHALSHAEAEQYIAFGCTAPIAVIPNGVDIPVDADRTIFLDMFPQLQGKRLLLFLGRLHTKKGVDLLLQVWDSVFSSHLDWHLVIAGPDSDGTRGRLERIVDERCLSASVTLVGMLFEAQKWSALAASEVFVLPSFSEGLSVSTLEAMGMGLPVLITHACNLPEVNTYMCGWSIDASGKALHLALKEVLTNCKCRNAERGARGRALILQKYRSSAMAQKMMSIYEWVLGGQKPQDVDLVSMEGHI